MTYTKIRTICPSLWNSKMVEILPEHTKTMVPQFMCHVQLIIFLYDYSSYTISGNNLLVCILWCTILQDTQIHVQNEPLFHWVTLNNFQILPAFLPTLFSLADPMVHGLRSSNAWSSESLIYRGSKSLASQTSCSYSPLQNFLRVSISILLNLSLDLANKYFPIV